MTDMPPAELLMGCQLRSRLDLLQPDLPSIIVHSQAIQKSIMILKNSTEHLLKEIWYMLRILHQTTRNGFLE